MGLQDADAGIRATRPGTWATAAARRGGDRHRLHRTQRPVGEHPARLRLHLRSERANDGDGRDADAHDPGNWSGGQNSNWHGTHVSGTIAAVTNNAKGIAGAAFGARLVPVRVLGVGGGDGSDIVDGIVWASGGSVAGAPANANPAEVLNLSLGGGGGCSATYQAAIDGAVARGSLVVVAAGNENLDASSGSLSTCNNVVVVGAHSNSAVRSSFSNYGAQVDISAPGSTIYSTINTGTTVPAAEGYANYQGTSMATPHVARRPRSPGLPRRARPLPYTPAQLEAQLKATAYPMAQGCSVSSGAGHRRRAHAARHGRRRRQAARRRRRRGQPVGGRRRRTALRDGHQHARHRD
jgi:serine protease